jgi:transcriptional regulator with XRE-family HTH domain
MRRKMLNMSQVELADGLGITFQQVQKYENGSNRISASRLQEPARICRCRSHSFLNARLGVSARIEARLYRRT